MCPVRTVTYVSGPDPRFMERAMGIEPTSEAWEASILPLYDARSLLLIIQKDGLLGKAECTQPPANALQSVRTRPRSVARVLRTSDSTRIIPIKGTRPATTTIVSKACVGIAWFASEK